MQVQPPVPTNSNNRNNNRSNNRTSSSHKLTNRGSNSNSNNKRTNNLTRHNRNNLTQGSGFGTQVAQALQQRSMTLLPLVVVRLPAP
jgi:hypothetical protein